MSVFAVHSVNQRTNVSSRLVPGLEYCLILHPVTRNMSSLLLEFFVRLPFSNTSIRAV